jgi:hypothetical protein
MRFILFLGAVAVLAADPEFTADGQLKRPANYREWIYLSSGLGMNYGNPTGENANPIFDNVFVEPSAYRQFVATGRWPEKTMFVLELRRSSDKGSINKGGRFQTEVNAREVALKDSSRFEGGWGYFDFGQAGETARVLPQSARCYACHSQNGAVENTFVQFYPTLLEIARQKKTLRTSYLDAER